MESKIQRVRHASPATLQGCGGGERERSSFSEMRQWGFPLKSCLLDLVTLSLPSLLLCFENFMSSLELIGEMLKEGRCHPTGGRASRISVMKTP